MFFKGQSRTISEIHGAYWWEGLEFFDLMMCNFLEQVMTWGELRVCFSYTEDSYRSLDEFQHLRQAVGITWEGSIRYLLSITA